MTTLSVPASALAPRNLCTGCASMRGCLAPLTPILSAMNVRSIPASPAQLVASIVHERLVGVDTAIRTVVPPGVELQGQRCQPTPPTRGASSKDAAAQPESGAPVGAGLKGSTEEPAGVAALPTTDSAERDPPPGGMPSALHLMQRRLGSAAPAAKAAYVPAPLQALQLLGPSQTAPAAAMQSTAASTQLALPALPSPAAAAAKGKWRTFVQGQQAASAAEPLLPEQQQPQQQQHQHQRDKPKTQGQQDIRTSLSQWQQRQPQRAGMFMRPAGTSVAVPEAGLPANPSAKPPSSSAMPAPSLKPGGMFARFALGGSSPLAVPAVPAAAQQPTVAAALQPRQAPQPPAVAGFESWTVETNGFSGQENNSAMRAPSKCRKRKSSPLPLPSRQRTLAAPLVPSMVETAPRAPEAATALLSRKLLLPKLAWLSGRFSSADAAGAADAADAAQPQVLPATASAALPSAAAPAAQLPCAAAPPPTVERNLPAELVGLGGGVFDFL